MATAAELIEAANNATSMEELDAIAAQAEDRVTVIQAVADNAARLEGLAAAPANLEGEPSPPTGHETDPDYVWVGCGTCWTAKTSSQQVVPYGDWLADGYRHLTFYCATCSEREQRHIEVHPTLLGVWLEDTHYWQEGGYAAPPTEVQSAA